MQVAKVFVKNVRVRMEELDLTHADLAKRLNIPASGVSRTLSEETAPRIDTLIRWAEALETTPQRLLGTEKQVEAPRMESLSKGQLDAIGRILTASEEQLRGVQAVLGAKSIGEDALGIMEAVLTDIDCLSHAKIAVAAVKHRKSVAADKRKSSAG